MEPEDKKWITELAIGAAGAFALAGATAVLTWSLSQDGASTAEAIAVGGISLGVAAFILAGVWTWRMKDRVKEARQATEAYDKLKALSSMRVEYLVGADGFSNHYDDEWSLNLRIVTVLPVEGRLGNLIVESVKVAGENVSNGYAMWVLPAQVGMPYAASSHNYARLNFRHTPSNGRLLATPGGSFAMVSCSVKMETAPSQYVSLGEVTTIVRWGP